MSEEQRMIIDATTHMQKSQLREILSFIRYIQFKSENIDEAPEDLIIKDDEDFIEKIKDGMEDTEEIPFEEVMDKMNKKIESQMRN